MWRTATRPLLASTRARAAQPVVAAARWVHPVPAATPSSQGQTESQSSRAEKMMRRFWKNVAVEQAADGKYTILLDKRKLRTPGGKELVLSEKQAALALLVADEWENQIEVLKPHTLPITSILSRAIDGLAEQEIREQVVAGLLRYLDTDTVCFHETEPPALVKLQNEHWVPLMAWASKTYSVPVEQYADLFGTRQPVETILKLGKVVESYDAFKLAAFERAVLASKSYLIALGLVEGYLSTEEAARCAHVEVSAQTERWGEVEDTHDVDNEDVRVRLGSAALLARAL